MSTRTVITAGYGFRISSSEIENYQESLEDEALYAFFDLGKAESQPVMLAGCGMDGWYNPCALISESVAYYRDYPYMEQGWSRIITLEEDAKIAQWQETLRKFACSLGFSEPKEFGICLNLDMR